MTSETDTGGQSWLVGKHPDCDMVVAVPTVSSRHCRLKIDGDGFVIEDLNSTNGTYVNGRRLDPGVAVRVSEDDRVTLGQKTPLPWPSTEQPQASETDEGPVPPLPPDEDTENSGIERLRAASSEMISKSSMPPPRSSADPPQPATGPPTLPRQAASPPGAPGPRDDSQGTDDHERTMVGSTETKVIHIGRDPKNDVVLDYPAVSGRHAQITIEGVNIRIEDLHSTNGTFLGPEKKRISTASLLGVDVVFFGPHEVRVSDLLSGNAQSQDMLQDALDFAGEEMTFGRDPSSDYPLNHPMISWQHARIYRQGGKLHIEDLGSTNGTFVNGQRVSQPQVIEPGDNIALASYVLELTDDGGLSRTDFRGRITIEARNICVDVPGKRLIENISLTIEPGEFVGLMGPSGAGKSTLMNALNGYTPPSEGQALINGTNLYDQYDQFRGQIGYVPQDDIMHSDLTVGQALYYTARLRLPRDFTDAEIKDRIKTVLAQLGLQGTENVLIGSPEKKGISGGQRKRVNLAMELLTDPSLLFLDEPTSGLSSEDALTVMKVLRGLADSGKSILLTIHQPSIEVYKQLDHLCLIAKDTGSSDPGRLAYYGPAYAESIYFFNPELRNLPPEIEPSPDEVLRGLAKQPAETWIAKYYQSTFKQRYVDDRAGSVAPMRSEGPAQEVRRNFGIYQWWTLTRRCMTVKLKDTWNTALLMIQAPVIAILIVLVFGKQTADDAAGNWSESMAAMSKTIFLIALSGIWFGCSNAAREIVGEWAIYFRERMVNLKIPSYLGSKFTVLGAFCLVQCAVLLSIVHYGSGLKGNWLQMYLMLVLASMVGVGIGLTVSAIARSSEMAIASLPLVILPMVILGGILQPTHDMNKPAELLTYVMPSRWAFEAVLLIESSERPDQPQDDYMALMLADDREPYGKMPDIDPVTRRYKDPEKLEPPDMAEKFFPGRRQEKLDDGRTDEDRYDPTRTSVFTCTLALLGMLVLAVGTKVVILRSRDVH